MALPLKVIHPDPKLLGILKFCVTPESFVIPAPLMVKPEIVPRSIVNALAPAAKTMLLISIEADASETAVVLDRAKVAISFGPSGTVTGVQLDELFHLTLAGVRFQVALPAVAI